MGYQVFVMKFENGDTGLIPYSDLTSVLSKYGSIVDGNFGLEFLSDVGELFEYAPLSGHTKDSISGISFNRPTVHQLLPQLIFDLLSLNNTCFFGPDLKYMQSRFRMAEHIPDSLLEHFPEGPEVISGPLQKWPLS